MKSLDHIVQYKVKCIAFDERKINNDLVSFIAGTDEGEIIFG